MRLPKILILNQPFNRNTGGGITMSNLFAGWEKDKLAVACVGHLLRDQIDADICNTYYQLGHKEHQWVFPFNLIKRKYESGLIQLSEKKIHDLTTPVAGWRVKLIMNYFYPFLEYIGAYHFTSRLTISKEFCHWLDEWQPDLIYAQAADRMGIAFCRQVQEYLKKPMVFHMMDDWPSIIGGQGPLGKYWTRKIDSEFRALLAQSAVLLSISDYMSEEYQKRYGRKFVAFHNPIDLEFWKQHQRSSYELNDSPTILYAGRTGKAIQDSLKTVARAVTKVNMELDLTLRFILQTAEPPGWISEYECVQHRGFVPYSELPKTFATADVLILPYDFSAGSLKYIKYSMPTKASEYMASGSPVLVFAPAATAVVQYAQKQAWALVATENDVDHLSEVIKEMITHQTIRKKTALLAKDLAESKHNARVVTAEFRKVLQAVVEQTPVLNKNG